MTKRQLAAMCRTQNHHLRPLGLCRLCQPFSKHASTAVKCQMLRIIEGEHLCLREKCTQGANNVRGQLGGLQQERELIEITPPLPLLEKLV